MRLFQKPGAILGEIGRMRRAEQYRREDRATVSHFFNGQPPITDAEAEALGLTMNVNHLFGYTELRNLRDQMVSLHTKPARMVEVELDSAPPGKRLDWGFKAQQHASEVLKQHRAFKTDYIGAAGDAAMHGESCFFFANKSFPLARQVPLSRLLVPDSASTDPACLTHFAIEDVLQPHQLSSAWRKRWKDWKSGALGKALKEVYKDILKPGQEVDVENCEEMEYRRQENSASTQRRTGIPVVYFFQQRPDQDGPPFDLTIIRRFPGGEPGPNDGTAADQVLFERHEMYPRISAILHPFFMDCILGGAPKWHRVMGTGTLNYQLNIARELLINRAMQATYESSMNLWLAKDAATREQIQKVLVRHNGVIPENLELVQQRYAPNFTGMLEMIQFFGQQGARNARGQTTNSGQQNDLLEVQAISDQNRAASEGNMASSEWYDYYDGLLDETFSRLASPFIDTREPGYSMVMDFQRRMEREGIPLFWIQPHNVRVKAVRIIGDGLRSNELAASQVLANNRQFFAPEMQPQVNRLIVGLGTGNYRLAEDLVPMQQKPDAPQLLRAQTENAIMLTSGEPIGTEADDIDEVHVPIHMKALESMIMEGVQDQKAAFTPKQANSFKNIGGHCYVHIQRIEGKAEPNKNDANRQMARALTDQLNQYAALGEKLLHNMQQLQEVEEGQGEPMSQAEQAKIQLAAEGLKLQREKLSFGMEKFARSQGHREQGLAFEQMLKLEGGRREDERSALERRKHQTDTALRDVETAVKVQVANKPQPAAT